jgi:hypothetical protein
VGVGDGDDVPRRIKDLDGHDAYAVLGLDPSAGPEEIAQAYRRAMSRSHPDRGGSPRRAQLVNCAFDVLTRHREEYDRGRAEGAWSPVRRRARRTGRDGAGFDPRPGDPLDDPFDEDFLPPRGDPLIVPPDPVAVTPDPPPSAFAAGGPRRPGRRRGQRWSGRPGWFPTRVPRPVLVAIGVSLVVAGVLVGRLLGNDRPAAPAAASPQWTANRVPSAAYPGAGSAGPVAGSVAGSVAGPVAWSGSSPVVSSAAVDGAASVAATPADGPPVEHRCEVRADQTLWCWGGNGRGQLGNGSTADSVSPVQVAAGQRRWVSVAVGLLNSCALQTDGELWCWGDNSHGQLGDGGTAPRTTPGAVAPGSTWVAVAVAGHVCAVRADHTLWCWGAGGHGELGDGGTAARAVPGQVGREATWAAVVVQDGGTCGIRQNGSRQCWGLAGG